MHLSTRPNLAPKQRTDPPPRYPRARANYTQPAAS